MKISTGFWRLPNVVEEEKAISLVIETWGYFQKRRCLKTDHDWLRQIGRCGRMQVVVAAFHRQLGVVMRRAVLCVFVAVMEFEVMKESGLCPLFLMGLKMLPKNGKLR